MFLNFWSHIFYFLELETITIAAVNSTVKHLSCMSHQYHAVHYMYMHFVNNSRWWTREKL